MTKYEIPLALVPNHSDTFARCIEYLKDEGAVSEDEVVTGMDLTIRSGQPVKAEIVTTEETPTPR